VRAEPLDLRRRILVVDDDPSLRLLVRATLPHEEFAVEDASSAEEALPLALVWRPTLVVLDVHLPGASGLSLCRRLKGDKEFASPTVVLLTAGDTAVEDAQAAGADALLRKPFSPLELVKLLDRLPAPIFSEGVGVGGPDQLLIYARDLSRTLQQERRQRQLLEEAYRQTVAVLVDVLEAKDPHTSRHAVRVRRYALELADASERSLLDDPSLEYGFLLHDVGKIAVPDRILNKPAPLDEEEMRLVRRHPVVGAELLRDVALLAGEGIRVVRSHHERWDGHGYPDGLAGGEIPFGARVFAVADALDAMTSDRPYRRALPWRTAAERIRAEAGRQFDPHVVAAFASREPRLRSIHGELSGRDGNVRPGRPMSAHARLHVP
jgi:ribonuclease P protein subunit RPR2